MPRQVFKKVEVEELSDVYRECKFEELEKGDKFSLRDIDDEGETIDGYKYYVATSNPYENSKGIMTIDAEVLNEPWNYKKVKF